MNKAKLIELKPKELEEYLEAYPKNYSALTKYRNLFLRDESKASRKKLRFVETLMKRMIEEGGVTMKRRKKGTGERVVETHVYKDNTGNRKLNRVGQTYEKVVYKNAEMEEVVRDRLRRRKNKKRKEKGAPSRRNFWIEAVTEAKQALNTPSFVIVYKTVSDPDDEKQVIGHNVYKLAMEIMQKKKKQAEEEAAETSEKAASESEQQVEPVDSIAKEDAEPKKKRRRRAKKE